MMETPATSMEPNGCVSQESLCRICMTHAGYESEDEPIFRAQKRPRVQVGSYLRVCVPVSRVCVSNALCGPHLRKPIHIFDKTCYTMQSYLGPFRGLPLLKHHSVIGRLDIGIQVCIALRTGTVGRCGYACYRLSPVTCIPSLNNVKL